MAHIAHQPGPVSRWLVGVVGLGAELHQRPHAARGALLQFDWRIETRATPQAVRHCDEGPGRGGSATPPVPGRDTGGGGVLCHNPQALSNVQEENLSCARDQVVIARPPALARPHDVIGAIS
jgi:hypothetical protein